MKKLFLTTVVALFATMLVIPALNEKSSVAYGAPTYKTVKAQVIVVNSKAEADKVKSELNNGGSFYAIEKKYSISELDSYRTMTKTEIDQNYPELSELAKTMKSGEISNPVETQDGWVIIKMISRTY